MFPNLNCLLFSGIYEWDICNLFIIKKGSLPHLNQRRERGRLNYLNLGRMGNERMQGACVRELEMPWKTNKIETRK